MDKQSDRWKDSQTNSQTRRTVRMGKRFFGIFFFGERESAGTEGSGKAKNERTEGKQRMEAKKDINVTMSIFLFSLWS